MTNRLADLVNFDGEWRKDAACRNTDPDLFFPKGTTEPSVEQIETAKAICRQCMAQVACLEYAIETRQDDGIWGGTSEDERRVIIKAQARQRRSGG